MGSSEFSVKGSWSTLMKKELLDLYLDGMELDLLALHLNVGSHEVVRKLSELLLGIEDPRQNSTAKNYRKPWHWGDDSKLWRMYAVGVPIPTIADKLGRDELGICYRILAEQYAIVPKAIVEKYKLDEGNFASECDSPYRVKTCPNCLDVVVYCKCSLE